MAIAAGGRGGLLVRCDPELATALVAEDGVTRMVMQGREMAGWLRVEGAVADEGPTLQRWVDVGRAAAAAADG